uniref:p12 n=1 Tax=Hibiscus-infecting cilevirus TaxID=2054415 RepID=A0A8K1IA93_9VIRU|nr:p12 [Hibiscus-infecting cilevirus]
MLMEMHSLFVDCISAAFYMICHADVGVAKANADLWDSFMENSEVEFVVIILVILTDHPLLYLTSELTWIPARAIQVLHDLLLDVNAFSGYWDVPRLYWFVL